LNVINFKGERCGGWRRIRQMAPARTSPPAGAISSSYCAAQVFVSSVAFSRTYPAQWAVASKRPECFSIA